MTAAGSGRRAPIAGRLPPGVSRDASGAGYYKTGPTLPRIATPRSIVCHLGDRASTPHACPLLGDRLCRHARHHPVHRPRLHLEGHALHPARPPLLERAGRVRVRRVHAGLRPVRDSCADGSATGSVRGRSCCASWSGGPSSPPRRPGRVRARHDGRALPVRRGRGRLFPEHHQGVHDLAARRTSACARRACSGWRRAGAAR